MILEKKSLMAQSAAYVVKLVNKAKKKLDTLYHTLIKRQLVKIVKFLTNLPLQ